MSEEEAYEFVKKTLRDERIIPYQLSEIETIRSVEKCINCGLCINHCPVVRAVGLERFSGPRSIAVALSRSPPEFWSTADVIYLCTGCGTCREVCPKSVNIPEIVNTVRARIFKIRSDLVPKGLITLRNTIADHRLAFEPWEDPEEKAESRDMRLEQLGIPLIEDRLVESAEVLFYPGCQAEERSQEIREAAKVILNYFSVDYTLLDEMICCGLPARLLGDAELAENLAVHLREQVAKLDVKCIVTTCAGCTSSLNEIAKRNNWGIPVYHMLEYLVETIGIKHLLENIKAASPAGKFVKRVTIHDPCHLIRHVSRQVMEYATAILSQMPNVELVLSEVSDSCCGGGGLVGYHSPDVAQAVTSENIEGIEASGAEQVVTPCPLCTAQIENELFKSGSSVEVEDLTVFIARHLNPTR